MPLELIADHPGHAALRSYEDRTIKSNEIRVRTLFSSVKHGTEFRAFASNSPDSSRPYDRELGLHSREGKPVEPIFPQPLGNMCYGVVTEVGSDVSRFAVGNRVFGYMPTRETHTLPEDRVRIAPGDVSVQALMYMDPAVFALGGLRDGNVRLGDRVAVFGLGAIGQMAVQMARLAGARWVVAVDLIDRRRTAATRHGADLAIDPNVSDAGLEIKQLTNKLGVDVAIETSGSSHALYDALRSIRYAGTVVSTAYYSSPMHGLYLAGEFHRNRPTIVSSRACSEPNPEFGWNNDRIEMEVTDLLAQGRLAADDLIDPVVSMQDAAAVYQEIYEHPERSIKLGIEFDGESTT